MLNGAPTFMTLVERARRPHEVRIELPPAWTRAMSGLDDAPDLKPNHFRAVDYETLVDSPIMAGDLGVREFQVAGKMHYVVSAGDVEGWDAEGATRRPGDVRHGGPSILGSFSRTREYDFLLVFRQGGGGLEHKNSTLSTVAARPGAGRGGANAGRGATAAPAEAPAEAPSQGRRMWGGVGLLSHESISISSTSSGSDRSSWDRSTSRSRRRPAVCGSQRA